MSYFMEENHVEILHNHLCEKLLFTLRTIAVIIFDIDNFSLPLLYQSTAQGQCLRPALFVL